MVAKRLFSLQNIISLMILFIPVALYLLSANAISGMEASVGGQPDTSLFSGAYLNFSFYLFIMLEVGLYLLLILVDHYANPLYYTLWLTFIVFPYFHVGTSVDFCMRATIPSLFVLMIYVAQFMLAHFKSDRIPEVQSNRAFLQKVCAYILLICLVIGMATPVVEFYRGFYHVIDQKTIFLEDRRLMTFNRDRVSYNFVTATPEEHFFFKYLAK